jgi:hypothetical protein
VGNQPTHFSERAVAGLLKQLFGEKPYAPMQTLPTDGWCQIPGIARMNLVWPWYSVPEPEALVDSYGRSVGVTPQLELHAPRSDHDIVWIVWSEQGGGFVVGSEWAASVVKMYSGGKVEANIALQLNGAMGRLARINDGRETHWRAIVPRHESAVHMEASAPSQYADAYWSHIETMLATWGWDD